MPYVPANVDIFAVPGWDKKHPDLHKRYISLKPDKLRGHTWDFGTGGYIPYGSQFETLAQLKDAAKELGLTDAHINTALQRITVGDLMLAYISKDEAERRTQERLAMGRERQAAAVDSYLASERKGITPRVFETEEEYVDVKKHATREGNPRVGYRGHAAR